MVRQGELADKAHPYSETSGTGETGETCLISNHVHKYSCPSGLIVLIAHPEIVEGLDLSSSPTSRLAALCACSFVEQVPLPTANFRDPKPYSGRCPRVGKPLVPNPLAKTLASVVR